MLMIIQRAPKPFLAKAIARFLLVLTLFPCACGQQPGAGFTPIDLQSGDREPARTEIIQPARAQQPVTATPLPTQPAPGRTIYVIDPNEQGILSNIFLIDPDSARIVWTITTRTLPEAVLSPDRKRLIVADSYRTQVTRGEQRDVISVYDAVSGELLVEDVPVPKRLLYKMIPHPAHPNLFLSEDGRWLFAGQYGDPDIHQFRFSVFDADRLDLLYEGAWPTCTSQYLGVFDHAFCDQVAALTVPLSAPRARAELPDGWKETGEVLHSPDGKRLYVGYDTGFPEADLFTDLVAVYDAATGGRLATLRLPGPVNQIALSADGKQIYAVSYFNRFLAIYSTDTYQALAVMENLGGSPALILVP